MVYVTVNGLPKNVKPPKFIGFLEQNVFGGKFHTKLTNSVIMPDAPLKSMTLAMTSNDGRKARRFLDGLLYRYNGMDFPLQCWTENDFSAKSSLVSHRPNRSRSPMREECYPDYQIHQEPDSQPQAMLQDELMDIDRKIQLLKKQRILMEEENKILLEKKKAEMLKNIGPNDYEKLENYERACGKIFPTEVANKKIANNKLPNFRSSCYKIIGEMQDLIHKYVNIDNRKMVLSLLNTEIKKRLVVLVKDRPALAVLEIVRLYRSSHDQSTDEELLKGLVQKVSQCCWPESDEASVSNVKQNETENIEADVSEDKKEDTGESQMNDVKNDDNKVEVGKNDDSANMSVDDGDANVAVGNVANDLVDGDANVAVGDEAKETIADDVSKMLTEIDNGLKDYVDESEDNEVPKEEVIQDSEGK